MTGDLTFITNESGQTLKERFGVLIKDSRFFDVIVGYFYAGGFYELYRVLENTEKIRILVGIGVDKQVYNLLSHKETKEIFSSGVIEEMENSEDSPEIEKGVRKFVEWIKNGKLEIRAYPSRRLHAKLYIMTFKEEDRDAGRVITGSSNFT